MSSTYGENLKLSIFGQSHGPAIGMTLDGIPAGLAVDLEALQAFLSRRAPGGNNLSTSRKEADQPQFLSGVFNGFTSGDPIAAVIPNHNPQRSDYQYLRDTPRPGHADYTAQVKYGGYQDASGGGHFSGRLTAPVCIAGGLCKQWLEKMGIFVAAHIRQIGRVQDTPFHPTHPEIREISSDFPVLQPEVAGKMQEEILSAKACGDSIGGSIQCAVVGLPAGVGDPIFDGMESKIAQMIFGIPAVKALSFGAGKDFSHMRGSEANDPFVLENGKVTTLTNHNGGILGGITTGMPLLLDVVFKPTPSIAMEQQTISLSRMENTTIKTEGRHDPCIVPRAVPVVEAAVAIAVFDALLGNTSMLTRS